MWLAIFPDTRRPQNFGSVRTRSAASSGTLFLWFWSFNAKLAGWRLSPGDSAPTQFEHSCGTRSPCRLNCRAKRADWKSLLRSARRTPKRPRQTCRSDKMTKGVRNASVATCDLLVGGLDARSCFAVCRIDPQATRAARSPTPRVWARSGEFVPTRCVAGIGRRLRASRRKPLESSRVPHGAPRADARRRVRLERGCWRAPRERSSQGSDQKSTPT